MHSFTTVAWVLLCVGGSVEARALRAPSPIITPAPSTTILPFGTGAVKRQQELPDPLSFVNVLLTAIPLSLRQIAATNAPAVSSILWEEFLDDKRPQWFLELPWEIQVFLKERFAPGATWMPSQPAETSAPVRTTGTRQSVETDTAQPSDSTSVSQPTTALRSSRSASGSASSSYKFRIATSSTRSTPLKSRSTALPTSKPSSALPSSASTSTSTSSPLAPPATVTTTPGLTHNQKLGIGIGTPLGLIGAAALFLGCCILLRRRQRKRVDGSIPPSSPGFIPRFAFQEKDVLSHSRVNSDQRPLNDGSFSAEFQRGMSWDDDGADLPYPLETDEAVYTSSSGESVPTLTNIPHPYQNSNNANSLNGNASTQPIPAPALYHTHSSNRARGRRTSYTSLHSVAEVSEPDDSAFAESPVLGRGTPPRTRVSPLARMATSKRYSPPRMPVAAAGATGSIKRKPVPRPINTDERRSSAEQSLLQGGSGARAMDYHSISPVEDGYNTSRTSPARHSNPFTNSNLNHYSGADCSTHSCSPYEEDYGPEYADSYDDHHARQPHSPSDYMDISEGLYGGNTRLSPYAEPNKSSPKSPMGGKGKTEWPLRSTLGSGTGTADGNGQRRNLSPLWDRVYEHGRV